MEKRKDYWTLESERAKQRFKIQQFLRYGRQVEILLIIRNFLVISLREEERNLKNVELCKIGKIYQ